VNLCAIVPSHNHHTVIASVVARLRALGLPVFVIDDGSSEPARSAIAALAGDGVTLRRFEDNQGKGAAVVDGFRLAAAAGFTHAVQVDADGQHDLDALPALLAAAEESPDALVSGEPVYDASMPLGRKIGRWITHIWVWIETLSLRITDSMCGFRVYPLAAVLALLAEESVGRRMDFDTDIMVRLFWRGTPVRMVPVRVVYPPANTSNFDMLRDNVRISWMHTRLVLSMLCRQWCKRSPQVASHWSALGERGAYWGLRFCAGAYRLLGRRGCLVFMAPIVFYFFAFGRQQRRASQTFLSRALNRPVRLRESYRHFLGFAARALDTFIAWTGGARADAVHIANGEVLAQAMTDPRGAVVVVSHLGNVDLARALMDPETRQRLTVLVHTRHAVNYNRILSEVCPEAALNMVQVTEMGPATAIDLKERVERGEWVVIAGDRTPVLSQGRVSVVPFLGHDAAFSQGPWILAAVLDCPVYLLFCLREGDHHTLTMERFAERIALPRGHREVVLHGYATRYAGRLEDYAQRDPFQWFNFFDFWAMKP